MPPALTQRCEVWVLSLGMLQGNEGPRNAHNACHCAIKMEAQTFKAGNVCSAALMEIIAGQRGIEE